MRFLPATANFSVRVKKLRRISRLLKPLCYCLSRKTNVLCISLHLATTGPWIAGCVTEVCTVLVGSFSNGMRITCPMRKFSALNPGFASQIALADTLRYQLCPRKSIIFLAYYRKRTKFILYLQDVQCHYI